MNIILVALGYGDENKGGWTEYFAHKYNASLSVRYNGGCQGMHYVRVGDQVHGAQQFSAASLAQPKLETMILGNVPVNPTSLMEEARAMEALGSSSMSRLKIAYRCPIVTPAHNMLCRVREDASEHKIGTTGIGVRELMADITAGDEGRVFRIRDFYSTGWRDKLQRVVEWQFEKASEFGVDLATDFLLDKLIADYENFIKFLGEIIGPPRQNRLLGRENIIFEPAQGFWLDRQYGHKPYVTSTDTTARPLAGLRLKGDTIVIGLTRAFTTRHGPGPLPHETDLIPLVDDNVENHLQGKLRTGWLDTAELKYAIQTTEQLLGRPLDALAVSHLDIYEQTGRSVEALLEHITVHTGVPVHYISNGPHLRDRHQIAP